MVFAHELGHEFTCSQQRLISLFFDAAAHVSTTERQRLWGVGKVLKPEEKQANLWAANELVDPTEWMLAEEAHPGYFVRMGRELRLPTAAAVWRSRIARGGLETGSDLLDDSAKAHLDKDVIGEGGPQSLLRRLNRSRRNHQLSLTRKDFNQVREYSHSMGGGWGAIFDAVLDCSVQAVRQAGGLTEFFR